MDDKFIYLETYVLQQDMRIRLPKTILPNMNAEKGKTLFDIYLTSDKESLVLRVHQEHDRGSIIDDDKNT